MRVPDKKGGEKSGGKRFRNSEDGGGTNHLNDDVLFNDGASLTSLEGVEGFARRTTSITHLTVGKKDAFFPQN